MNNYFYLLIVEETINNYHQELNRISMYNFFIDNSMNSNNNSIQK